MIIVQKFHSIHEIDPEFIPNLEVLLQEDYANFNFLIERHDNAPSTDVFTYFLFFGPTQNAPIGFSQICLRKLPLKDLIPWHKKILGFMNKEREHWKQLSWQVGDGSSGLSVFDARFARSGREKMQALIKEYEARPEIMSTNFYYYKGIQDFQSNWKTENSFSKECFILEPLMKSHKNYQAYLEGLSPKIAQEIKESWKKLHLKDGVKLGDYLSPTDTPNTLPVAESVLKTWEKLGVQVLTFEKELKILGCIVVLKGKNGNVFFEPFPFEPEGQAIVNDELYIQYAILKFFELTDTRKCHMMKFGSKLVFEDKEDLVFFQNQGFQSKTATHTFTSRLPTLVRPI